MIVVPITLWSAVTGQIENLGTIVIDNIGGTYPVPIAPRSTPACALPASNSMPRTLTATFPKETIMPNRALRVLTVWQPWASLIIEGAKPFEFRGWRPPTSLIGQRIVIHAAARKESPDEVRTLLYQLKKGGQAGAMTCLRPDVAIPILERRQGRPLSCGLGTALVGEPRNGFDIAREFGVEFANDSDRNGHANWGWPMDEIERWAEPIQARGRQGLWNWPTAEDAGL